MLVSWKATLDAGVKVCPPLALAATLTHIANAYLYRDTARYSAAAAVCTIGIVPFTGAFLKRTNDELFSRERAARGSDRGIEASTRELVRSWGSINLMRALLPAVGALVGCLAL